MYYHNGTLKNGETVIDANDGSYRYAGADPDNYVCFGSDASTCPNDNLYRIIGVFGNQVKLIKYDYANSNLLGAGAYKIWDRTNYKGNMDTLVHYNWASSSNSSNVWSDSKLNETNLNSSYLSNLGIAWSNYIATATWKVGGNTWSNIVESPMNTAYQKELISPAESTTYSAKIGLMYVSDYGYAASPTYWTYKGYDTATTDYRAAINENWMYMGLDEWTISRVSNISTSAFTVNSFGTVGSYDVVDYLVVRPTFYLNSDVIYTGVGNGSSGSPYRIS